MMKNRRWLCILLAALMLLSLAGCGAQSMLTDSVENRYDASMEMGDYEAPFYGAPMEKGDSAYGETLASDSAGAEPEMNRKWIVTVNMDAETEDLDTLLAQLGEKIRELKGYVEDQNIYNGSSYANRRYRSASMTVRVPADQLDAFIGQVKDVSNVVSYNESQEDVTLTYVSTESRIKALETEQARLLELLGQAQNMSDLLEIEARLTDVRYELESVTSQLLVLANKVDYATVRLYISQVKEYTEVEEQTVWQRIATGFKSNLKDLGEGLVDFFVWLIVASPFLMVYGGIAFGIFRLIRLIRKKRPASRPRKWRRKAAAPEATTEEAE
jgi:hypothetical protein